MCFRLTNDFRNKNNLDTLVWSDNLFEIALEHSKNMANKTVSFGHKGFNKRFKKVNFEVTGVKYSI